MRLSALARALSIDVRPEFRPVSVVVADPPWAPSDKLPGDGRGAAKNYDVLTEEEIGCFLFDHTTEIPPIERDALLFLWRLSSMVEEAYRVCRSWGFVPKTEIVWQKLTPTGKPWFGMGRSVRASHETCIVAARGSYSKLIKSKSVRSTFSAPVPQGPDNKYVHSAKPPEFFQLLHELCGTEPSFSSHSITYTPALELFARQRRGGCWYSHGKELRSE